MQNNIINEVKLVKKLFLINHPSSLRLICVLLCQLAHHSLSHEVTHLNYG